MKIRLLLIFLVALPCALFAQNRFTKITGTVVDSAQAPLPVATIVLLQARDSVMYGFTTSNKAGEFEINKIEAGDYVIQIAYVGHRSYSKKITVSTLNDVSPLGKIQLIQADTMLDAVDITADYIPIVVKKDTIEYNARAFKTLANASVEELLKRLPGVEVDAEGGIKAQGEDVNKILVDGKEFFGEDPKIATKNLPADAVNKVQVFDKMSELSEFTGVDDGERNKTINLTLKEDKKNGIFGSIKGGYGTDNRHSGKLNINNFTDKLQLSVISSMNNINESSFSMGEYFNFMGGMSGMMGGSGGMMVVEGGSRGGNGIMNTKSAGINFNYDLSKKTELRSSYFYNNVNNLSIASTLRDNFLDGATFNSFETSNQNNITGSHRADIYLKHEFSKKSDVILTTNVGFGNGSLVSNSFGETRNSSEQIENSSERTQNSVGDNYKISSSLTYRQKLNKVGRSLVADIRLNTNNAFNELDLYSLNDYKPYDQGLAFSELINQFQDQSNEQINFGGKISYTEPIGKKQYLEFNFANQNYRTDLDKDFYDIVDGNPGETRILNTDLSSLYNRDYYYNRGGITYTLTRNKLNINTGLNYQVSELKGTLNQGADLIEKSFNQFLPMLTAKYNFTTSKNLNFRYSTTLTEPSLEQLQPIVNNEDPVNVYIGNPDLKAQFNHRAGLSFHSFDQFNYISIFGSLNANYTNNKITNSRTIDEFLRQTTTPVNVDFDKGLSGYISFGAPLKWMGTKVNLTSNFNLSKSLLFINSVENLTDRNNTSVGIRLDNRKKELVDWSIGTNYTFSNTDYSVNSELNQKYLQRRYYSNIGINVKKWTFNTTFNYTIYSGQAFGENSEIPLWNAYIARSFMKYDKMEFRITVFDLLNQNIGISRDSQINYIEEVRYNALERYFLFSLTYNLSKFGKKDNGFVEIIRHD